MGDPCIICVAITGSLPRKSDNPAVPITVSEQVESTHEAFEAGATICHAHVRNPDESPSSDPEKVAALKEGLEKHCPGLIIQFSTGGRSGAGQARGAMLEETALQSVTIHPNGARIRTAAQSVTARLLVDAMGHFSPLARQARGPQPPDAVCLVVGTCATGYPDNDTGDLLASFTPIRRQCQYFWEAFPARDGRTTYLFTYLDAHPQRPDLEELFDDYFALLPEYQNVSLDQLDVKRALFGLFPCYRDSPLQFPVGRLLAIGDSSGNQSPLSFGGFGAMLRHLKRLTNGISEALEINALDQDSLALLQPYQPSLSVTWLFQQTMSVGVDEAASPNQINELLSDVFTEMHRLGDPVLKPFLQDVVQFPALTRTLAQTSLRHPSMPLRVLPQVGLPSLLRWLGHYGQLGIYAGLDAIAAGMVPLLRTRSPQQRYRVNRWREAWRYGAGADYEPNVTE